MENLAYSDERWLHHQFSLPHLLFELGSERVKWFMFSNISISESGFRLLLLGFIHLLYFVHQTLCLFLCCIESFPSLKWNKEKNFRFLSQQSSFQGAHKMNIQSATWWQGELTVYTQYCSAKPQRLPSKTIKKLVSFNSSLRFEVEAGDLWDIPWNLNRPHVLREKKIEQNTSSTKKLANLLWYYKYTINSIYLTGKCRSYTVHTPEYWTSVKPCLLYTTTFPIASSSLILEKIFQIFD